MQPETFEDLDWLSFRYIAGELPPEEADAFESRLAADQAAREAVARSVHLSRALTAALQAAPTDGLTVSAAACRRRTNRAARWMGWTTVAGAVCLAGICAYWAVWSSPTPDLPRETAGDTTNEPAGPQMERLALLWSRTRDELESLEWEFGAAEPADSGELLDASRSLLAESSIDQQGPLAEGSLPVDDPPSWMLAAVEAGWCAGGAEQSGSANPEEN